MYLCLDNTQCHNNLIDLSNFNQNMQIYCISNNNETNCNITCDFIGTTHTCTIAIISYITASAQFIFNYICDI